MLIPLGTDRSRRRTAFVTYGVIAACVMVHLVLGVLNEWDRAAVALAVRRDGFEWWQLFSSAFLHGGWLHLLFNMLVLAALGPNVEDKFGHTGFVVLYAIGAAASGTAHIAFSANPAVGASGAIAAVTGSYLVLFPGTRIICFAFWITVVGRVAVPAWWFIGLSVAVDLLAGGLGGNTGIAHFAHLGGYALGIGGTMLLLQIGALRREPADLFTILRQRRRRAAIQAAVRGQQDRVRQTMERGREAADSPEAHRLAMARREIARLIGQSELAQAASAFERFADDYDLAEPGNGLPPDQLLRLAEHLLTQQRTESAVRAFRAFVTHHPAHAQAPSSRLMLGLLLTRRLGRPNEARSFVVEARERLVGDELELADELLREIETAGDTDGQQHTGRSE
ncbi:MAG: rhomboid family intramembrane serine protease [Phycisphaerales bacterium]